MATYLNELLSTLKNFTIYFIIIAIAVGWYSTEWTAAVAGITLWSLVVYHREIKLHLKTLPRDVKFTKRTFQIFYQISKYQMYQKNYVVCFQELVKKHPYKIALIHENDYWTYQQVEDYSNQIANYFRNRMDRGDVMALYMENKPEFLCIWLGLAKIGVLTALINTNQRLESLLHSFNVVNVKAVIYGSELSEGIEEVKDKIIDKPLYVLKNKYADYAVVDGSVDLETELKKTSKASPDNDIKKIQSGDKMLFIYTSGTTGLPKAAVITHNRCFMMAHAMKHYFQIRNTDVLYTALPLYHSAGGILGSGQPLIGGTTQVIKTKFSSKNFWKDCIKYDCTVAQYIGEICRYLLASAPTPEQRLHRVRLMYGNGLRPQIWEQFVQRFGVQEIGELYGSTEGNANMANISSKVGSCGSIPWFLKKLYPVYIIRADPKTNEPIRDKNGLCSVCKPGEPGLLVGKIVKSRPTGDFEGYTDKKASSSKIITDVFEKGDSVFNTGDILVTDEEDNYYFKDRTGDTFRWKGENVSTCEVEAAVSNICKLQDAVVYGVQIPDVEGRAGMVAIADEENQVNLEQLAEGVKKSLPQYARPLFVRILKKVNLTGTFKLQKTDLQKDGFDPSTISDPIYFNDSFGQYVPLTPEIYREIISGKRKF